MKRWIATKDVIDGEIVATMVEVATNGYYLASEVDELLDRLRRDLNLTQLSLNLSWDEPRDTTGGLF
jgi:hypothetical protein